MAWNMTFAFHQSLVTQPADLDEAARVMRLTKWQRFWRLDVPSGMIPLVWNGMMSFGGAWFFLAASESISVLNHTYAARKKDRKSTRLNSSHVRISYA